MASPACVEALCSLVVGLGDAEDAKLVTQKFESLLRPGSQNALGEDIRQVCKMVAGGDDGSPAAPLLREGVTCTNGEFASSSSRTFVPVPVEQQLISLKKAIQKGLHDWQATDSSAPGPYNEPGVKDVCVCKDGIVDIQNVVAIVTEVNNMSYENSKEVNAKSCEARDEHIEVPDAFESDGPPVKGCVDGTGDTGDAAVVSDAIEGGNDNSTAATVIAGFSAFAIADEEPDVTSDRADVNVFPPESVEAIQTNGGSRDGDDHAEIDNAVFSFTGLNHVAFCIEDLERSLGFYCGLLGLKTSIDRPELPYRGAWLFVGAEGIHLMEVPNPDPVSGRPAHGGFDRHACLNCKNVEGVRLALEQAGILYQLSMVPSIFTRDPDGNGLELIEVRL